MEPNEIRALIAKADEALEHEALEEKAGPRREQAVKHLLQARDEARAAGQAGLEELANRRLEDLGAGEPTA